MTLERKFWTFWLGGLVLFAITITLGLPLSVDGVTEGVIAHQKAGSAERVDEIQAAWNAAGLRGQAIAAMASDLVFIGIYSLGAFYGGMALRDGGGGLLRALGTVVVAAAIVFGVTDYVETIGQFIQLLQDRGSDALAGTAATVRPIKVAAWIVTFVGILAGLVVRRISSTRA